jgi:hypothetical protein
MPSARPLPAPSGPGRSQQARRKADGGGLTWAKSASALGAELSAGWPCDIMGRAGQSVSRVYTVWRGRQMLDAGYVGRGRGREARG